MFSLFFTYLWLYTLFKCRTTKKPTLRCTLTKAWLCYILFHYSNLSAMKIIVFQNQAVLYWKHGIQCLKSKVTTVRVEILLQKGTKNSPTSSPHTLLQYHNSFKNSVPGRVNTIQYTVQSPTF